MAKKTAPRKKNRKDNSLKAGIIAFGATLLAYASLFKFHRLSDFLLGGGIALLVSSIVKAMATPMKGLDKTADAAPTLDTESVVDDYARELVESGIGYYTGGQRCWLFDENVLKQLNITHADTIYLHIDFFEEKQTNKWSQDDVVRTIKISFPVNFDIP